jgi:hypothetical protein
MAQFISLTSFIVLDVRDQRCAPLSVSPSSRSSLTCGGSTRSYARLAMLVIQLLCEQPASAAFLCSDAAKADITLCKKVRCAAVEWRV